MAVQVASQDSPVRRLPVWWESAWTEVERTRDGFRAFQLSLVAYHIECSGADIPPCDPDEGVRVILTRTIWDMPLSALADAQRYPRNQSIP